MQQMQKETQIKQGSQVGSTTFNQMEVSKLKINGDNESKVRVYAMRITIIVLIILIIFLRFAVPRPFLILSNKIEQKQHKPPCNPTTFSPTNVLECTPFSQSNLAIGLILHNIADVNQFCIFYIKIGNNTQVLIDQEIDSQLYGIKQTQQKQFFRNTSLYNDTFRFKTSSSNYIREEEEQEDEENKQAAKYFVGYSRDIMRHSRDENFSAVLLLRFTNFTQLQSFQSLALEAIAVNPNFTFFCITIRAVFSFLSLITAIIYFRRYCQLEHSDRTPQIKFIAAGSVLVFFFNDPFFVITILGPNPLSTFFSTLVVVVFLVFLLFLQIFFLRRIYHEQHSRQTGLFNIKTMWVLYIVFFLLFVLSMALFCTFEYFSLYKIPMMVYGTNELNVIPLIISVAILMSILIIYQIILLVLILKKYCCNNEQEQNRLLFRNVNFIAIYLFFFIIYISFFLAGAAMTFSYDAVWILYGYSFMNLYVYILQYLYYTPTQELEKRKPPTLQRSTVNSILHKKQPKQIQQNIHNENATSNHHQQSQN